MKTEYKPQKREIGEPRKKSNEIRVDSWNKEKSIVIFIGNNNGWALTNGKEYSVIKTELISNIDDELHKKIQAKLDKRNHRKIYGFGYSHMMPRYFQIINDFGNKRYYPQELFKVKELLNFLGEK